MLYARVENDIVREVADLPDGWVPGITVFHKSIAQQFHAIPEGEKVAEGWKFNEGVFSPPDDKGQE